jgi:hypothetical protein
MADNNDHISTTAKPVKAPTEKKKRKRPPPQSDAAAAISNTSVHHVQLPAATL